MIVVLIYAYNISLVSSNVKFMRVYLHEVEARSIDLFQLMSNTHYFISYDTELIKCVHPVEGKTFENGTRKSFNGKMIKIPLNVIRPLYLYS